MRAVDPADVRMAMTSLFESELRHGLVVGVGSADLVEDAILTQEEAVLARGLTDSRRRMFVAGRAAMHLALVSRSLTIGPVLSTKRGAPFVPGVRDISMSISHKESIAVALVGARDPRLRVGVDVEIDRPLRFDIARRVLTEPEIERMHALAVDQRSGFVLRRFSAKEAIYKAIDPFVKRYVAFREVSLSEDDHGWTVDLHLTPSFPLSVEVAQAELVVERVGSLIISTASARVLAHSSSTARRG